jgi:hypothetical protein
MSTRCIQLVYTHMIVSCKAKPEGHHHQRCAQTLTASESHGHMQQRWFQQSAPSQTLVMWQPHGLLMEKSICAYRAARLHCILLVPPATFLRAQQYCTAQQYCRYDHAALHISLPTSLIPTAPLLQCFLTFALSGLTCSVLSHHSMLRAYSSCWKAARARLDIRATCTHTYKRRCHGLNQADR